MVAERYYSISEMADGAPSGTANVTVSTTAGTYDTGRQRGSMKISNVADFIDTAPFIDQVSPTTLYFTATIYQETAQNHFQLPLLEFINSSGQTIVRMICATNAGTKYSIQYWSGSASGFVDIGSGTAIDFPFSTKTKLSGKIICGGASASTIIINVGTSQVLNLSVTNSNLNNVARVRHRNAGASNTYWTELAGANFDLKDLLIRCDPPTGNSTTNTAWTGAFGDVDEAGIDDTDFIASGTTTQREGFTHASYTLPGSMAIDSVWVTGRGRVGIGGPTDAKFSLRIGSTNYDSSALGLSGSLTGVGRYWATDPSTSAAWAGATNYNSAEFGALSI